MNRTFVSILLIVCLFIPVEAAAHTYLKSSSPQENEMITELLQEITLLFDTHIEPLSTFEVLTHNEEKVDITITLDHDTLTGVLNQPLTNGSYTVHWYIISADGHPNGGSFSFTVEGVEAEQEENTSSEENYKIEEGNSDLTDHTTTGDPNGSDTDKSSDMDQSDNTVEESEGTEVGHTAETEVGMEDSFPAMYYLLIVALLAIMLLIVKTKTRSRRTE